MNWDKPHPRRRTTSKLPVWEPASVWIMDEFVRPCWLNQHDLTAWLLVLCLAGDDQKGSCIYNIPWRRLERWSKRTAMQLLVPCAQSSNPSGPVTVDSERSTVNLQLECALALSPPKIRTVTVGLRGDSCLPSCGTSTCVPRVRRGPPLFYPWSAKYHVKTTSSRSTFTVVTLGCRLLRCNKPPLPTWFPVAVCEQHHRTV